MGKCLGLESCCSLKLHISWANLFLWKFVSFPVLASLIIFYLPTHIWKQESIHVCVICDNELRGYSLFNQFSRLLNTTFLSALLQSWQWIQSSNFCAESEHKSECFLPTFMIFYGQEWCCEEFMKVRSSLTTRLLPIQEE